MVGKIRRVGILGKQKLQENKKIKKRKPRCLAPSSSYRGIPQELHLAVKHLAEEYSIPLGEMVTVLFQYAVRAYELGRLSLSPTTAQSVQLNTKWETV